MAAEVLSMLVFSFFAINFIIFIAATKRRSGRGMSYEEFFSFFSQNLWLIVLILFLAIGIALIFVFKFRNHKFIVGYEFDYEKRQLNLLVRNLSSLKQNTVCIDFENVLIVEFREKRNPFKASYDGIKVMNKFIDE